MNLKIMEATEVNIHTVVYPNPWINERSRCIERGNNNAATPFQMFEVTENHSYKCIYTFLIDCIEMGGINLQTIFDRFVL